MEATHTNGRDYRMAITDPHGAKGTRRSRRYEVGFSLAAPHRRNDGSVRGGSPRHLEAVSRVRASIRLSQSHRRASLHVASSWMAPETAAILGDFLRVCFSGSTLAPRPAYGRLAAFRPRDAWWLHRRFSLALCVSPREGAPALDDLLVFLADGPRHVAHRWRVGLGLPPATPSYQRYSGITRGCLCPAHSPQIHYPGFAGG